MSIDHLTYKQSIDNIDDMIFARQGLLKKIRYSFIHPTPDNSFCFLETGKVIKQALKLYRECEKLKKIRSEMYMILSFKLA